MSFMPAAIAVSASFPSVPLNITNRYRSVMPAGMGLLSKLNVNSTGDVFMDDISVDDNVHCADTE